MGKNGKKKKVIVEQKVPVYTSSIEDDIVFILGSSHTKSIVFNDNLEVGGLYTYRGSAYCLDHGMDFSINDVSEKGQEAILDAIKEKKYRVDSSFQG